MSKGKGYLLPLQIAGHELECVTLKIPKNLEYRTAFVGHLLQLGKWWTWAKDGTTNASEAGRYWSDLLLSHLVIGGSCEGGEGVDCCNEISIEINNVRRALSIQQNQWRIENATAIETQAQEVVGTNYSSSGESPLCTALNFYVKTKMLEALNLKRALAGLARFSNLILGNALANFFDGILGGTVFAVSYANATAYETAFNDAPTNNAVQCALKGNFSNVSISQMNFQTAINALTVGTGNQKIIVETLKEGANDTLNYLFFLDCMLRAVPLSQMGFEVCECGGSVYWFLGAYGQAGTSALPSYGETAIYRESAYGGEYFATLGTSVANVGISVLMPTIAGQINRVTARLSYLATRVATAGFRLNVNVTNTLNETLGIYTSPNSSGQDIEVIIDINPTSEQIIINFWSGCATRGDSAYISVHSIKVE